MVTIVGTIYHTGYDHPWPPSTDANYLNCGFIVVTSSRVLFDYFVSLLKLPGRSDIGSPEQNLLNYARRREKNMPWKPLWYGWNWPTEKDWRGAARSFHAKYWDSDPSHDPIWKRCGGSRGRNWRSFVGGWPAGELDERR
jgi:alpha-N-acetylglucosamine transferase